MLFAELATINHQSVVYVSKLFCSSCYAHACLNFHHMMDLQRPSLLHTRRSGSVSILPTTCKSVNTMNVGHQACQQGARTCQSKHRWLLGMFGPCPLRRRAVRTARYASMTPSIGVSADQIFPGHATRQAEHLAMGAFTVSEVQNQMSRPDVVQLARKPQPQARARSLPSQPPLASQIDEQSADDTRQASGAQASTSGTYCEDLPVLRREHIPMSLPRKASLVQQLTKQLQERAAQLASIIPEPPEQDPSDGPLGSHQDAAAGSASLTASLGPGGSTPLNPRLGGFMPQFRLARMRKRSRLGSCGTGSAAVAGDGDTDAVPYGIKSEPGSGSPSDSGSGSPSAFKRSLDAGMLNSLHYGRPPLGMARSSAFRNGASPSSSQSPAVHAAASQTAVDDEGEAPPRPTSAEMEITVRSCANLPTLRALYDTYADVLSRQELVLYINHLASLGDPVYMSVRLWAATQELLVGLLQRLTGQLDTMNMVEYVVVLAAVAKLRYVPPPDWIQALLTQSKSRLYNATPSQLTTTLRALARIATDPADVKGAAAWESWMRRYLSCVQRHLKTYRGDEMVKTLVALSDLRYRPPPEWMVRFSSALHEKLDVLEAHMLSEAMLAFASLRYQPEGPFLGAYYSQLHARLPLADDRDLATFAQAGALLDRLLRQDFMLEFLAEVLQKLPTFQAQPLANLLNALGRLVAPPTSRLRLPPGWVAAVAAHISGPGVLKTFSGPALASASWGLSVLGHKASPKFLDDLLSASYGKLHTCGPTDLILFLTALGNYQYTPGPDRQPMWATWMAEFEKLAARKAYDTRGVCDLMAALARLPRPAGPPAAGEADGAGGVRPPHSDFLYGVLRSTRMYNLRNTSPARLAGLAGSLAVLRVRPDFGFLYNFAQAARFMWSGFSMRDYALLLGALVHIGTPGVADPRWAGDFLTIILCRMGDFDGPGLVATLEALQHLPRSEFQPSRQWLEAAVARAVDLVRTPPTQAAAAAPAAPPPEVDEGDVETASDGSAILGMSGPMHRPLSYRPDGQVASGGSPVTTPEGRVMTAPPMQPMTPGLMVVLMRALAALGYRAQPNEPLVMIVRQLLARNASLVQLRERAGEPPSDAVVVTVSVTTPAPVPAPTLASEASGSGGEVPQLLLSAAAAADLQASLDAVLCRTTVTPTDEAPQHQHAAAAASVLVGVAAAAGASVAVDAGTGNGGARAGVLGHDQSKQSGRGGRNRAGKGGRGWYGGG